MKCNRLAVFVENKKGDFYQVGLNKKEMDLIVDFISQIQGGSIKVLNQKFYGFSFVEESQPKEK